MFALVATMGLSSLKAGDSITYKATAELVSCYVWRGTMASNTPTPNFQPTLALVYGNLEIGIWGSTSFNEVYKEVEPYISYGIGSFKLTLTDYDWNFEPKDVGNFKAPYFNYAGHRVEGSIGYTGPASLPISISLNTMFWGYDKKASDPTKQAYSTYAEIGYALPSSTSLFLGFTPSASYYNGFHDGFSVVNIGATSTRNIKITSDFSLPVRATVVFNPQAEQAHLVFGITF